MSKKEKSNEVVAQENTAMTMADFGDAWGGRKRDTSSIIIPIMKVVARNNTMVGEFDGIVPGCIADLSTKECLGTNDSPVKLIPFYNDFLYKVEKRPAGTNEDWEYHTYESDEGQHRHEKGWNYEFFASTTDGLELRYRYVIRVFFLRPDDPSIPYTMDFSGGSIMAGRLINSRFERNEVAGLVPPAYMCQITTTEKQSKKNNKSYYTPTIKFLEETPMEMIKMCAKWVRTISAGQAHAQNDLDDSTQTPSDVA